MDGYFPNHLSVQRRLEEGNFVDSSVVSYVWREDNVVVLLKKS